MVVLNKLALIVLFQFILLGNVFAEEPKCWLPKVQSDFEIIKEGCHKLAEEGDAHAQEILAKIYFVGIGYGAPRDWPVAERWSRIAIQNGSIDAYSTLINILTRKDDEASVREGVYLFFKLVKKDKNLRFTLMTDFGERYKLSDYPEIFDWIIEEAKKGDEYFQDLLAEVYQKGFGVPKNIEQSIYWYEKLSKNKSKSGFVRYAYYALGLIYEKGEGVPIDKNRALEYYKVAAKSGDNNAKIKVQRLESEFRDGVQPLPKLRVNAHKNVSPPFWVGHLYSDGTIDIIFSYEEKEWVGKDFNKWVEGNFLGQEIPDFDFSQGEPDTNLIQLQLSFSEMDEGSLEWFPRDWYSLKSGKAFIIDRLVKIGSECDVSWHLVTQSGMPFDSILSDGSDMPHVVDTIVSWKPNVLNISTLLPEQATDVMSLTKVKARELENGVFDKLINRGKQWGNDITKAPQFSHLSIWEAGKRDKTRRVKKAIVSQIHLSEDTELYQVLLDFYYDDKPPSWFQTLFSGWILSHQGKLTLLNPRMSLMDIDWKSIDRELPVQGGVVLDGKNYILGEHYAVDTFSLMYEVHNEGVKLVFRNLSGRSCE